MSDRNEKLIKTSFLFDNQVSKEVVVEVNATRSELRGVYKLMDAYVKKIKEMEEPNKPQLYFEACELDGKEFELKKRIEEVR